MIERLTRTPMFAVVALALAGALALPETTSAQQPPPPPSTSSQAPGAAPVERRPPSNPGMNRGMMPGGRRPGMQGNFRADRMHGRGDIRSHFRGGPGGFHGPDGAMGAGFRIAPPGMWWKNPMVVQRLALTAEQTKRMDDIFQQSRIELIDLKADVEKQQVMLEPLLSANPLDTAKAQAQIDKVADARANLEKADAKMLLGIRGVLTADQWTKLRDRRFGDPAAAGQGAPAPAGGRGRRGGGPSPTTSNLVDPIDQP